MELDVDHRSLRQRMPRTSVVVATWSRGTVRTIDDTDVPPSATGCDDRLGGRHGIQMAPMISIPELEPAAIRAAHRVIDPAFTASPQFVHDRLSARLGAPVVVKVETVNPIRSFKGRGAWLAVQGLASEGRIGPRRPLVCASAGNFGQGVAYAARSLGQRVVVFASRNANAAKVDRMRHLGAEVVIAGEDFDAARAASRSWAREHEAELLVDGEDPRTAAGASTMVLEITDAIEAGALPPLAVASVPVGNGALINGVGSWLRGSAPACRVVGIQAAGAPAMTLSWRAGRPIDTPTVDTYADGIAARVAIPEAVAAMAGRVDDMVLVGEEALHAAQAELTAELGVTVEGAAAASWAGLLAGPRPAGPALVIVTGSNV
jgi:threonine dehydratase